MLMHLINVALPELISDENFTGAISVCLTPFPFVNLHDDSANNTWWHCLTVSRTSTYHIEDKMTSKWRSALEYVIVEERMRKQQMYNVNTIRKK